MAIPKHLADQLDRLAAGRPSDQDNCLEFMKLPMARMVALKAGTQNGGAATGVYAKVGGEWHYVRGVPVKGIKPSIVRGPSLQARQAAWAKEQKRQGRLDAERVHKEWRAKLIGELQAAQAELESLRQVGADRERAAELMAQEDQLRLALFPAQVGVTIAAERDRTRDRGRVHLQVATS